MWGSFYVVVFGGLLAALLVIAIAFGTSALLFPVVIAAAIALGVGIAVALRGASRAEKPVSDPRSHAAPASGEGSGSPTSPNAPRG